VVEASCRAQGLVLAQVADGDVRVRAGGVLDEIAEDRLVVVADDEDLADLRDLCNRGEAVRNDWVPGNLEEWLGKAWLVSVEQGIGDGGIPWAGRGIAAGIEFLCWARPPR
jgi:hypothetical protein